MRPGAHPIADTFLPVRKRDAHRELQKLNEAKAAGPDAVSVEVLKRCAGSLALPCHVLSYAAMHCLDLLSIALPSMLCVCVCVLGQCAIVPENLLQDGHKCI